MNPVACGEMWMCLTKRERHQAISSIAVVRDLVEQRKHQRQVQVEVVATHGPVSADGQQHTGFSS